MNLSNMKFLTLENLSINSKIIFFDCEPDKPIEDVKSNISL